MTRKPLPPPPGDSPAFRMPAPYHKRYRLRDVADLIYYDGPLLSLCEDTRPCPTNPHETHSVPVLIFWCDVDDEVNRWMIVRTTWPLVVAYLTRSATLLDVFRASIATDPSAPATSAGAPRPRRRPATSATGAAATSPTDGVAAVRAAFEDLDNDLRVVRFSTATLAEVAAAGYLPGEDSYLDADLSGARSTPSAAPPAPSAPARPALVNTRAKWFFTGSKAPDPSTPVDARRVIVDVDAVETKPLSEEERRLLEAIEDKIECADYQSIGTATGRYALALDILGAVRLHFADVARASALA